MALKIKLTSLILIPVFIIALVIVLIIIFSSDTYVNRDYPEIKEKGVLKVVTDYNTLGYYASGDTIAGFNKELLDAIEKYSGLKIEVDLENDLLKSMQGLRSGKYDLIARNIPINTNLKDHLAFTQPILRNKLVLVQPKNRGEGEDPMPIRSHLDLAKVTIDVSKASPAILRLKNLSREIGDTIFIREDSLYEVPQLIMKVASGEINYTVSDASTARLLAQKLPAIDIETDIGFTHLEAWAVRRNTPALLDSLNSWLNRIQDSREFLILYNKYYKE